MATHSSIIAWRIPGMEDPGGLPSLGSHRVGHDWSDLAAAAAAVSIKWGMRKKKKNVVWGNELWNLIYNCWSGADFDTFLKSKAQEKIKVCKSMYKKYWGKWILYSTIVTWNVFRPYWRKNIPTGRTPVTCFKLFLVGKTIICLFWVYI